MKTKRVVVSLVMVTKSCGRGVIRLAFYLYFNFKIHKSCSLAYNNTSLKHSIQKNRPELFG